jgi:hypothetical protein
LGSPAVGADAAVYSQDTGTSRWQLVDILNSNDEAWEDVLPSFFGPELISRSSAPKIGYPLVLGLDLRTFVFR